MNKNANELSQRYAQALEIFLKDGSRAGARTAVELGNRAMAAGMETLELARIHEAALAALAITGGQRLRIKRAQAFFTEAIAPIVKAHRPAHQDRLTLGRLNEMLQHYTRVLAVCRRQLKRCQTGRGKMENAARKKGAAYARLLKDSQGLQHGFRKLVHKVLAAQEVERKRISRELHDEVAQSLLGINVRLLNLKKQAKLNTHGIKSEIASTRLLVIKSTKKVHLVAKKLGTT